MVLNVMCYFFLKHGVYDLLSMFDSNYGSILHRFDIFAFAKCDLEIRVIGDTRSSNMVHLIA